MRKNINSTIASIIQSYPVEKKKPFGDNDKLNTEFESLANQIELILSELKVTDYKIDFSYGKGQWAIVPWLAILRKDLTTSVSHGVYIVLLFTADGGSVYLTLNQGTGGINKAQIDQSHIDSTVLYQNKISNSADFSYGELAAGSLDSKKRTRPRAYEKACIYAKKYTIRQLGEIDVNEVVNDLKSLISLYFHHDSSSQKKIQENNIMRFNLNVFSEDLDSAGLIFNYQLLTRFISSLITKPFVILTGLSGSGKTKLAQAFTHWICQDESQCRIIPVGADWTNREPLLGYPNALKPEEYVKPESGVLDLIIQANNQPKLPHFLILDEMNLSHVERYFADFLSVMESKEEISLYAEATVENGVPVKLKVPSNLFVIGTVNIDETTNMFSPKVLDRANTIEFQVTQVEMKNFLGNIKDINMDALTGKGAAMAKSFLDMTANKSFATRDIDVINVALVQFFGELKKIGAEFGYRSATEILRLIHQLTILDGNLTTNQKIDIAIMQKLLPKLHGSRRKLCPVLETLGIFCISSDAKIIKDVFENGDFDFKGSDVIYPLSLEKITRMYRGAIDNGFASFAEA